MKHLKSTFAALATTALVLPSIVFAQTTNPFQRGSVLANEVGGAAYGTTAGPQSLTAIVGRIINVALGFLGVVFLVLLLYAGFLWMTAQGEEKTVEKAKNIIKQAIVGLIVIVAGFAISNFVLGSLVNVTTA
jgi:type IV secretion system pilin